MITIDRKLLRAASNFEFTGFRLFRSVVLPAALPQIVTGMRTGSEWRGWSWWRPPRARLSPRPARVHTMIDVALARPRSLSSPDFLALKASLLKELGIDESSEVLLPQAATRPRTEDPPREIPLLPDPEGFNQILYRFLATVALTSS